MRDEGVSFSHRSGSEARAMAIVIRQIHPVFVGEVSGVDLLQPLTRDEVAAIDEGIGWPVPEARAFLRDLNEEATWPENVYVHKWRQFDLVMWDNRQTMHRVRRFDESKVRDMRRTTVAGEAPTAEQVAA
jgi:hypothetical protein